MKYVLIVALALFIYACSNTRHSIGITTSPLSQKMNEKTKFSWKMSFGAIRGKENTD